MTTGTIILLAVIALVVLVGILLVSSSRRRDSSRAVGVLSEETKARDKVSATSAPAVTGRTYEREVALQRVGGAEIVPVTSSAPVAFVPPDPETIGVSRRQFLNRAIVVWFAFGLQAFGLAVIGFLWPKVSGGFGSRINVGEVNDVKAAVRAGNGFFYVPEGRMWITEYPEAALEKAREVYSASELPGMEAGLLALWQTCPHLGCRVPECASSQWFECPCHGSQYNRVGEKKGGPAPRGMDRFAMSVDDSGNFIADTGLIVPGPAIGTNTTGQEAEGPNCIGQASEH